MTARLIVMDIDSTLINQEVIDLLGEEAGVGEQVAKITERASVCTITKFNCPKHKENRI